MSDYKYLYGIVDASYILRRDLAMIKKYQDYITPGMLFRCYFQSTMKVCRTFGIKHLIGALDSPPYSKMQGIKGYKEDRRKACREDLEEYMEDKKYLPDTPEALARWEKGLIDLRRDVSAEESFQEVRRILIEEGDSLGFPSLAIEGFEADDLGYAFSLLCQSRKEKGMMVTVDRDWVGFVNKYASYATPKGDHRIGLTQSYLNQSSEIGTTLYKTVLLSEIYSKSHNNIPEYEHRKRVSFNDFSERVLGEDASLPDYETRRAMFDHMDMRPEIAKKGKLISDRFKDISYPRRTYAMSQFMTEHSFNLNIQTYGSHLKARNV